MVQKSTANKLAVVSVDLSGYSRLMEEDERGTHQSLMACFRDMLEPLVLRDGGKIIKSTGDGALLAFPAAKAAMDAMMVFQQRIDSWQQHLPIERRLVFRVGLHLTKAIQDDGDLYGHGVNLAVRLQEAAEPGSIYLSAPVARELRKSACVELSYLGRQAFKNLKRPVGVYLWRGREATIEATARRGWPLIENAMAAALIGAMVVLTPSSSLQRGVDLVTPHRLTIADWQDGSSSGDHLTTAPKAELASDTPAHGKSMGRSSRENGAYYPLIGQVSSGEDGLRLDLRTKGYLHGGPLVADRFRDLLQGSGTPAPESASQPAIGADRRLEASQRSLLSRDEIADDLYAHALMLYKRNSPNALKQARQALEESLSLKPELDDAHALLAAIYWAGWQNKWQLGTGDTAAGTLHLAQHHLSRVEAPSAMAHVVTSEMLTASGYHEDAIDEAERAMLLEPSLGLGYYAKGLALLFDGRPEKAEGLIRTARQLDPHAKSYLFGLALSLFQQERFKDAFSTLAHATAVNGEDDWSFLLLGAASGFLRTYDDAKQALGRFDQLSTERRGWFAAQIPYVRTWPFKKSVDRARLHRGLVLAGIPDILHIAAR